MQYYDIDTATIAFWCSSIPLLSAFFWYTGENTTSLRRNPRGEMENANSLAVWLLMYNYIGNTHCGGRTLCGLLHCLPKPPGSPPRTPKHTVHLKLFYIVLYFDARHLHDSCIICLASSLFRVLHKMRNRTKPLCPTCFLSVCRQNCGQIFWREGTDKLIYFFSHLREENRFGTGRAALYRKLLIFFFCVVK